jgi:hypothetical protein
MVFFGGATLLQVCCIVKPGAHSDLRGSSEVVKDSVSDLNALFVTYLIR